MSSSSYDVIVVGAGHNGLVCAWYLARRGLRVRVLERLDRVGGAAATVEFHPGFRNSVASYTVSLLNPKIIADMALPAFGLKIVERPVDNFLPVDDRRYLLMGRDENENLAQVAQFSRADAQRLPEFYRRLEKIAGILRDLVLQTPPNIGGGWRDLLRGLQFGLRLRRLDMEGRRDLLDFFADSAGDYLDRHFDSDPVKALIGFDSIVGNYASPYSPGSAYVMLHHVFGEVNGRRGAWGHAIGGMGAITQSMAKACAALGVEISTGSPVQEVEVQNGRVSGVVLANGELLSAGAVVSNLNPRLLYEKLIDPAALEPGFLRRMGHWKCASGSFRMNVALAELPDFRCLPGTAPAPHHTAGIVIGPSLAYMDEAYRDARRYGWSRHPVIEMLIPSTIDDSLAPPGRHVASLFCQQFAPQLPDGRSWDGERERAADDIIETVNRFAPNFKASVLGRSILSPLDLEREFGLVGGDIFHGVLCLNQLFSARPMLGYADYRGPIPGLYLCGSGTHPGGGVTGAPGYNAAREMLRDFQGGKLKGRGRF